METDTIGDLIDALGHIAELKQILLRDGEKDTSSLNGAIAHYERVKEGLQENGLWKDDYETAFQTARDEGKIAYRILSPSSLDKGTE